jgi:hypothetical protein
MNKKEQKGKRAKFEKAAKPNPTDSRLDWNPAGDATEHPRNVFAGLPLRFSPAP